MPSPSHKCLPNASSSTDERGATSVEYGLLVALIAAVIIASVIALGPIVEDLYEAVQWW